MSGTKTSQQVDAYMAVIVQTKQDASKTSRQRAVLRLNGGGPNDAGRKVWKMRKRAQEMEILRNLDAAKTYKAANPVGMHYPSNNITGLLGVSYDTSGRHLQTPYKVRIRNNGKLKTVGRYANTRQAGDAYSRAHAMRSALADTDSSNRHVKQIMPVIRYSGIAQKMQEHGSSTEPSTYVSVGALRDLIENAVHSVNNMCDTRVSSGGGIPVHRSGTNMFPPKRPCP